MIPFSDPSASYQSYKVEIDQAVRRVLDSEWYVLGHEVESFEREFAAFHGSSFASVGVANGTDAIALSLRALNLKEEEDEVITASHTAVATVAGIEQAGCRPVFADIDPITRCICPESLRSTGGHIVTVNGCPVSCESRIETTASRDAQHCRSGVCTSLPLHDRGNVRT